jgi:hypothetical protein
MHIAYWWESQKERERPLGRPRHRWVDNIKIDLREVGWDSMDWIELAQDRDKMSVDRGKYFEGACCLHVQGYPQRFIRRRIEEERNLNLFMIDLIALPVAQTV